MYQKVVNEYEWEGKAGKPAVKGNNGAVITLENLADFDVRQTDSAVAYIKQHAKDGKPFFMSVNFMGMHQPTSPNKAFAGKSHLGNYSDKMIEMDYNIGASWTPSGPRLPIPSSSTRLTTAPGRTLGPTPGPIRTAVKGYGF